MADGLPLLLQMMLMLSLLCQQVTLQRAVEKTPVGIKPLELLTAATKLLRRGG